MIPKLQLSTVGPYCFLQNHTHQVKQVNILDMWGDLDHKINAIKLEPPVKESYFMVLFLIDFTTTNFNLSLCSDSDMGTK